MTNETTRARMLRETVRFNYTSLQFPEGINATLCTTKSHSRLNRTKHGCVKEIYTFATPYGQSLTTFVPLTRD